MYITKINIKNVRAIKDLSVPDPSATLAPHTLIIGGNSTCKSTILRCIAIGLCTESHAAALLSELPGTFVGPFDDKATITLTLATQIGGDEALTICTTIHPETRTTPYGPVRVEDRVDQEFFYAENTASAAAALRHNIFAVGYGSGRGSQGTASWTHYRLIDAVYTLFQYDQPLQNPELILYRLQKFYPDILDPTKKMLLKALRLNKSHKIDLQQKGVVVKGPRVSSRGEWIPLDAIADGYRGTLTWLCDLVGWAATAGRIHEKNGSVSGIALVDEIEQHIHPSWQADLMPQLLTNHKNLQIIATTHSPFVVVGATGGGLLSLQRRRGEVKAELQSNAIAEQELEDVIGDPNLFDSPTHGPRMQRKLDDYRRIKAVPPSSRTEDQQRQLTQLVSEIRGAEPDVVAGGLQQELDRLRARYGL